MKPRLGGVIETAIYVADTAASTAFYERVLGLRSMGVSERIASLSVDERSVLLLFQKGGSRKPTVIPGGTIPPSDADGHIHFAFAIAADAFDHWLAWLPSQGVEIESTVTWERAGRSIYFRDPDGHSVELATPGIWEIY